MRNRRADSQLVHLKQSVLKEHLGKQLSVAQAAGLLNMHPKAFLRLKGRYKLQGSAVLWPKKPGPKHGSRRPYNQTPQDVEDMVVQLSYEFPYLGSVPLSELLEQQYGISLNQSTVYRILVRRTDRYEPGRKRWKKDPKLYCLEEPGIEVQMDACYPFGRAREIAVFDAVDDCSRYVCAEVFESEDLDSAKSFIRKLVRTSPFRINALRLDNRFNGLKMRNFCRYHKIRLIFNEAYHPEQNGKIERYHKTYKLEAVYRTMSFNDSLQTLRYKTALWTRHYNFQRPHGGLAMNRMTPAEKLTSVYLSKVITNPQLVTGTLQQYTT